MSRPRSPLPIEEAVPTLRTQLAARPCVVLVAPPGAGKTTRVPLALLDERWLAGGTILMLEPRRLAARAAAARMAELLGEAVGSTVGYRIRFDAKVSRETRIEVLTEGILVRRLQGDPLLDGVGLVIFDEFHERHLHSDLTLALALDVQRSLREDLKLLIMSATLDTQPIARLLGDAPIVESQGRRFPVDIRYAPRDPDGPLADAVAGAVRRSLDTHDGDVLAFLPGAAEIHRAQKRLAADPDVRDCKLCPLYGDLAKDAQDRALRPDPDGFRKIVLATPIAETSLTIEGVRVVVDSGFARAPRFDARSGLTRLETVRISKQSAEQRAGRAGRLAPGVCYRLWTEGTQRGLLARIPPEILHIDLAPLALELAHWGVHDTNSLAWLDPPPALGLARARELLQALDAIDAQGRITPTGKAMAALPVHPRLAHMLLAAQALELAPLACDIAALLSERDLIPRDAARRSCDVTDRVEALMAFRRGGRSAAQAQGADAGACVRVEQASAQWRRALGVEAAASADAHDIGALLALAYPDRIAQQREAGGLRYRLSSGKGVRLACPDLSQHPYVVAASLDAAGAEGTAYLAAPVQMETLRRLLGAHLVSEDRIAWDEQARAVAARRERRLGEIVLESEALPRADPTRLAAAMLEGLHKLGLASLPWSHEARELQARVESLRNWFPAQGWPDWSDANLLATLDRWLLPYLHGITRADHLTRLALQDILLAQLDWQQRQRLDEGAPTHLSVPSGSRLRLQYVPGASPVLAVKLQEMFGMAETPRIAWGKIAVTLHLLSPARRPIQVTQDLRGFWQRTYPEVKKELKGRYPKHPWPDDPWQATPTAKTKKRS